MSKEKIKSMNTDSGYVHITHDGKYTNTKLYHMLRRKHNHLINQGKFEPNDFLQDFYPFWKERMRSYNLYTGEKVEIMNRKARTDRADLSEINNKIHIPYFKTIVDQGVRMINSNPVDFGYDNSDEVVDEMMEYQNKLLDADLEFEIENINEEPLEIIEFRQLMKEIDFQTHILEASTMQDATGTAFWLIQPTKRTYEDTNDEGVNTFTGVEIVKVEPWYGERLKDSAITIEEAWDDKGQLYYVMTVWTDKTLYKYSSTVVDGELIELGSDISTIQFKGVVQEGDEETPPVEKRENPLGVNPIIEFRANENRLSVFEMVEDIANAIDLTVSDQQNEIEQFRLAYLFMHGEGLTKKTAESIIKKGGVIHANTKDANVKYLVKELKVDFNKYHLDKMINLVFSMSNSVDFGGEEFVGSGASSEARQWQIKPLEDRSKVKELFIQESLFRFSEAIEQFMILETSGYPEPIDASKVMYNFKTSIPVDIVYLADAISKVKGVVSNYTLSGLLPNVDSKSREQLLLRIEKAEDMQSTVGIMKAEQNNQPMKVGGNVGQGGTGGENTKPKAGGGNNPQRTPSNPD